MKKLLKFILLSSVVAGVSGCGNNKNSTTTNSSTSSHSSTISSVSNTTNSSSAIENVVSDYAYEIPENPNVYIHYYNYSESYNDWLTWIWPHEPASTSGARFYFQKFEEIAGKTWGTIAIDTTSTMTNVYNSWDTIDSTGVIEFNSDVVTLGIIIRNESGAKEYEADRYLDLTKKSSDGATHLYVIEGASTMWYDVNEVDYNRISTASFKDTKTIIVDAFQKFDPNAEFVIKNGDERLEVESVRLYNLKKSAEIKLKEPFDLTKLGTSCTLEVEGFGKRDVSFENLYESEEFVNNFTTDETLGAIYTTDKTTFKLWAPTASEVTLNLFTQGDTVEAYNQIALTKGEKGVWSTEVNEDLDGKYYTYNVAVAGNYNENVVDPYAQSTGINGKRGMILNMDALNPIGWENVTPPTVQNHNEAIVYELHTRDLTMDETWNGSEENRGKFLGLIEEGTTYSSNGMTTKTGFDYIKELGVTHVQLLPIYDFQSVDETRINDEDYKNASFGGAFNWGYDPQNYNSPEGSYSSDPYDGATRVRELKKVSQAYNDAGIGIIMDVVFNHMPSQANSSFEKIVPGYYFRGRNDSGAGSDTASERVMFRKFMVDVTETWVKEYKLSGYRFDLMGLHDVDTMNAVSEKVNAAVKENNENSNAIIYGEGWNMYKGSKNMKMAIQGNVKDLNNVGAFNDTLRDAIRGQGDGNSRGWVLGNLASSSTFKSHLTFNYSNTFVGNSINYCEAHDNMTLWDKYQLSGYNKYDEDYLRNATTLGASMVFTSQGTSFMHAGQEFLRTKEIDPSTESSEKVMSDDGQIAFNRNSYNSSDALNSLKWNKVIENNDIVNTYKEMIKMRKAQDIFRYGKLTGLESNVIVSSDRKVITLELSAEDTSDWKNVKVIYNAGDTEYEFKMDGNEFYLGFEYNEYIPNGTASTSAYVPSGSFAVIYY